MFNWFRSRRTRFVPSESAVRLGVELSLEDRAVPCSGHDMMDSAAMVATAPAALPATVATISDQTDAAQPAPLTVEEAAQVQTAAFAPPAEAGPAAVTVAPPPARFAAPVALPPDDQREVDDTDVVANLTTEVPRPAADTPDVI